MKPFPIILALAIESFAWSFCYTTQREVVCVNAVTSDTLYVSAAALTQSLFIGDSVTVLEQRGKGVKVLSVKVPRKLGGSNPVSTGKIPAFGGHGTSCQASSEKDNSNITCTGSIRRSLSIPGSIVNGSCLKSACAVATSDQSVFLFRASGVPTELKYATDVRGAPNCFYASKGDPHWPTELLRACEPKYQVETFISGQKQGILLAPLPASYSAKGKVGGVAAFCDRKNKDESYENFYSGGARERLCVYDPKSTQSHSVPFESFLAIKQNLAVGTIADKGPGQLVIYDWKRGKVMASYPLNPDGVLDAELFMK